MKMATKASMCCGAALALVVMLNGCAEDNEKAAMIDTTTGKVTKPVTPKGTPRSSSEAYKAMQNNDPMRNNKDYQQK